MKKGLGMTLGIIFALLFFLPASASGGGIVILIKGVSCPFCVYGVEKQLKKVPGVVAVKTNYKEATATIEKEPKAPIDLHALETAVQRAGFSVGRVELTLQGVPSYWEGRPAFKDEESGQLFLLVEPGEKGRQESLNPKKWSEIRRGSKVLIEGEGHFHIGLPPALSVRSYERAP